jgi:hypothetical protein
MTALALTLSVFVGHSEQHLRLAANRRLLELSTINITKRFSASADAEE